MPGQSRNHLIIGLGALAFAILMLLVWIPLDTDTGLIEKVRRQVTIGDAAAPSLAALFLLAGGALLVTVELRAPHQMRIRRGPVIAAGALFAASAVGLLLMRYSGPAAVWLTNTITGGALDYRLLRDTAPWKYTGFLLGGTAMIATMIMVMERRVSLRALAVALLAVLAMIAIYDLPFDDLLLPPNGDV